MSADQQKTAETRLPLVQEDVTAEWLSECLGHKVKSFEFHAPPITRATAGKLFVTVHYEDGSEEDRDGGRPKYVCIKGGFNPAVMAHYGAFVHAAYRTEVDFFNKIAPTLKGIAPPKAYWAGCDAKTGQGIVIMDDLNKLGCTHPDPETAWPVDRVKAACEQLAGLHAGTWGAEAGESFASADHYHKLLMTLVNTWPTEKFDEREYVPSDWTQSRITAAMNKFWATAPDPRLRCLVHGDSSVVNTFLTREGAPRFLDFQVVHVGSALHDVAYFVAAALSVEDRKAHELEVIQHYLDALHRLGGPKFAVDEVLDEYRLNLLSGIGWMCISYDESLHSRSRTDCMSMRFQSAILDHKSVELAEALPEPADKKEAGAY